MAVPKFDVFLDPILRYFKDGAIHSLNDVRIAVANDLNLSDEDLSEMLPSGKQSRYYNRVTWACTYLKKAGLIESPQRGKYKITTGGNEALASGEIIDLDYLNRFDSYIAFQKATNTMAELREEEEKDLSPSELLDSAFEQIKSSLASDLMEEIMKLTPTQFEKLVVVLLLKMGYGDGIEKAGFVTQKSNDGGIDGIIKEDQLGFSNIYIQAKQWSSDTSIGRQEIQKFVGALQGLQAQKGLFITTAKFSSGAKNYADNLLGAKVVLVDGQDLASLMIKHNVGVSTEHVYEVKKIDSDFFMDEL